MMEYEDEIIECPMDSAQSTKQSRPQTPLSIFMSKRKLSSNPPTPTPNSTSIHRSLPNTPITNRAINTSSSSSLFKTPRVVTPK